MSVQEAKEYFRIQYDNDTTLQDSEIEMILKECEEDFVVECMLYADPEYQECY